MVGWPSNGTRRWFLDHRREHPEGGDYLSTIIRRQAEHHRMVLAHGADVVLSPTFGRLNTQRGAEYTRYALGGLLRVASDGVYQELFRSGVRLRFYGEYREVLDGPEYRPMVEACEEITASTADGDGPLILLGLFADAPYGTIARLSVELFQKTGRVPDRRALIEAYYGVPVPDLSFYVGFEQPQLFDVPLLATGLEDLYFTLNPTPDLDERQLRGILYDHLVARRTPEIEYETLSEEAKSKLAEGMKGRGTVGLGRVDPLTGTWRPVLPASDGTG